MKTCKQCCVEKPASEFGQHKGMRDGKRLVCNACRSVHNKDYRAANPAKVRDSVRKAVLKASYGITPAQYADMFAEQGGVCAICDRPSSRTLHVDHDHSTGVVRGLLCFSCNTALGHLEDDIERVRTAAEYLERSRLVA